MLLNQFTGYLKLLGKKWILWLFVLGDSMGVIASIAYPNLRVPLPEAARGLLIRGPRLTPEPPSFALCCRDTRPPCQRARAGALAAVQLASPVAWTIREMIPNSRGAAGVSVAALRAASLSPESLRGTPSGAKSQPIINPIAAHLCKTP